MMCVCCLQLLHDYMQQVQQRKMLHTDRALREALVCMRGSFIINQ